MSHLNDTAVMPKLKTLKNQVKGHKTYINRIVSKVVPKIESTDALDEIHSSELESDLEYLESRCNNMEKCFDMCLLNPEFPQEQINEYSDYIMGVKRVIKRGYKKFQNGNNSMSRSSNVALNSTAVDGTLVTRQLLAHAKLPTVDVPNFYGGDNCWREYRTFIQMFEALVDSDPDLTDTLKVQYLRQAIKGDALKLVSHLDPVASNYALHLKTLRDAYKVGQEELNNIIGKLNEINQWQKCQSSRDLFKLLTHVRQHYYLLNQVQAATDTPDSSGDKFIVRSLMGLLPDRLGYEIIRKVPVDERTVDKVLTFIQADIDSCKEGESYGIGKGSRRGGGSSNHQSSHQRYRKVMKVSRKYGSPCLYCGDSAHCSHECTGKSRSECWNILKAQRRCFNCTSDEHMLGECSEPTQCGCGRDMPHSPSICKDRVGPDVRAWGGGGGSSNSSNSSVPDKGESKQNTPVGSVAGGGGPTLSADAQVFQPTSQQYRGRGRGQRGGRGRPGGRRGVYFCHGSYGYKFMQTAIVQMRNPVSGITRKGRLCLDTAAPDSFVLETTASELDGSPSRRGSIWMEVFGTDELVSHNSGRIPMEIIGLDGNPIPLQLFTMGKLVGTLSGHKLSDENSRQLSGYRMADPEALCDKDLEVDILIGLDHYWDIVSHRVRHSGFGPRLLDTKVGWVLSGALARSRVPRSYPSQCYFVSRANPGSMEIENPESVESLLHKFWDLNTVGVKDNEVSPVVAHFADTVTFDEEEKRMEVKVPWRKNLMPYLPFNYNQSLLRENVIQKKLSLPKNSEMKRKYEETMKKHLDDKVIELVPAESRGFMNNQVGDIDFNNSVVGSSDESHRILFYIPHHPVAKKDKLRIVFDASSQAYPGALSLNDCIHPGPSLLADLVDVLLLYRLHIIVLVGDITGAFHQLLLSLTDRDAFRFLWHMDGKLQEYRFCRVPFGCSVSPFLLNSTVRAHLKEALKDRPELYELVISSLYVDDFLGGGDSVQAVCKLHALLQEVLGLISMEWHGWMSNSEQVRTCVGAEEVSEVKVLGLMWSPKEDTLGINWSKVLSSLEDPQSKRDLLSGTASVWDPLGAYLPVILALKLMFQSLCRSNTGWKGKMPSEMREALVEWKSQLVSLSGSVIPRLILLPGYDRLELHGFADASLQAYGAVIYLKCVRGAEVDCNFVIARSRVAPMKGNTLQRLELMGALVLARLMKKVLATFKKLNIPKVLYYIDSRDALCWIQSRNIKWTVFIENRVTEIHELTNTTTWRHVSTEVNPADTLTRPVSATAFAENRAWFKGPKFLYTGEPSSKLNLPELEPSTEALGEKRRVVKVAVRTPPTYIMDLERFGSYFKLMDVTIFVMKFLFTVVPKLTEKVKYKYGPYQAAAVKFWVRLEQLAHYPQEVKHCPTGSYVSKVGVNSTNIMKSFRLFKDEDGLLRVSSRIQTEVLPWEGRNPILLPPESKFTRLVVEMIHHVSHHAGCRQTLTNIRQQYIIPRGRRLVRSVISKCVTCLKAEGKCFPMLASPPLPDFRLCPVDPFTNCGVDFAGPVKIKEPGRRKVEKGYIMVLSCAVTRSIGLELLHGLTVHDFTLALRRFCARINGVPSLMVSDNAATFKRAAKELEALSRSPKLQKFLNGKRIKWQFYLQRCPWWGGFIERMVGSVKSSLKKVVGEAYLSYVEFNTILLEIESLINARPILWDYDNPNEPGPIAPSDLLHGRTFQQFPPMQEMKVDGKQPQMCTGRLRYLEKLKTYWWNRWQHEYLKELQEVHTRRKVGNNEKAASPGDVVLVMNKNVPRGEWKLGTIKEVKPGADNLIRTAKVEVMSRGPGRGKKALVKTVINRSPTHLVPLEINTEN